MSDLIRLIWAFVVDLFRSRAALEAEVLVLRQQIVVLRRGRPTRPHVLVIDRLVLGWLCWLIPNARGALAVVRPETVLRWHRAGFPIVLALEVKAPAGPAGGFGGDPRTDPLDEPFQSAVGCNGARTHLSLGKDAPIARAVQAVGRVWAQPVLGGSTINMLGFDLRQGQASLRSHSQRVVQKRSPHPDGVRWGASQVRCRAKSIPHPSRNASCAQSVPVSYLRRIESSTSLARLPDLQVLCG